MNEPAKRNVFRVSFDFYEMDDLLAFAYEHVASDMDLVLKDGLHDTNYNVNQFLVRSKTTNKENGIPIPAPVNASANKPGVTNK